MKILKGVIGAIVIFGLVVYLFTSPVEEKEHVEAVVKKSETVQAKNNETQTLTNEKLNASALEISIAEAERYVELSKRNGDLPVERLLEYSSVVKKQAEKVTEVELANKLDKLSTLIKENRIKEVEDSIYQLK